MSFPNTLDTTTTIPVESASTPLATSHVTAHTAIQTAIIAIETLLGVTASAVAGTFNYILGEITGSDKAVGKTATQTVTNKTLGTGTKIALGSDATGDIYYNGGSGTLTRLAAGTTGYILKLVAGIPAWVAETVTVFMSTTVAGIGEVATSAEISAGTAIGSTGAPLVMTPDALAASTPVFNGSGLTNLPPRNGIASASTNLQISADTERTQASSFTGATYALVKSIQVPYSGIVRVKLETKDASGNSGDSRIYINGVYTGITHSGGTTYSTVFSDDIRVAAGDLVQAYTVYGSGQTTAIKNFRIYFDVAYNGTGVVIND